MSRISQKEFTNSLARIKTIVERADYESNILKNKFDVKVIRLEATGLSQSKFSKKYNLSLQSLNCLLYTSDAADE